MVAKIKFSKSIQRALNYNEQKVQQGKAALLEAANYLMEPNEMNFYQKLERFQHQMSLNERAKTNTVHISLNFDPLDKVDKEKMREIAMEYMKQIGYEHQPYLVYQHKDAAHPHVHIVTTNIRDDGTRIPTHNIGQELSEPARKALELKYELIRAEGREHHQEHTLKIEKIKKVEYGKSETRRAITNVLDHVIENYKYGSLAELNAVLGYYNVRAYTGEEGSRIKKNHGLVYRVLDDGGNLVGVPIKASAIYSKPTLKYLEEKFKKNEHSRSAEMNKLRLTIDKIFKDKYANLDELQAALKKENIHLVLRQNKEGRIYGVTYVDHTNKAVFNGSALGKEYSAAKVLERIPEAVKQQQPEKLPRPKQKEKQVKQLNKLPEKSERSLLIEPPSPAIQGIIENLFQPEFTADGFASELSRTKKRRKKRQHSLGRS